MKRGYLITIEGPEGAGKSTQREYIAEKLREKGYTVVLTREPGGTPLAERIRELLLTPSDEAMCVDTELLLMFAARAQHVQSLIIPRLEAGCIVLSDRFIDSTYAYQHYARKVPLERIQEIERFTLQGFQPDLCFLFDIPIEVGMRRASARGKLDRFEQETTQFFEDVRSGFLARFAESKYPYAYVNAEVSIEEVQKQIDFHLGQLVFN